MPDLAGLDLKQYIGTVPDFPKPGILFLDITPLLAAPAAFAEAIRRLAERVAARRVDLIAAAEARGFLVAAPLAVQLGLPLVPIRKPGKLPRPTVSHTYQLEYGTDTLQMHADAVSPGARVAVVDDLLATGGTVEACCQMIEQAGGEVAVCAFLIELVGCHGAKKLSPRRVESLMRFD